VKTNNICSGIIGKSVQPTEKEEDEYYVCFECGQSVHMADLGQVFHHETKGHKPIELDS